MTDDNKLKLTFKVVGVGSVTLDSIGPDTKVKEAKQLIYEEGTKINSEKMFAPEAQKVMHKAKAMGDDDDFSAVKTNSTLMVMKMTIPTSTASSSSTSTATASTAKVEEKKEEVDEGPPVPCVGGCGFFGSKKFDGHCSKCYNAKLEKDKVEVEKAAEAKIETDEEAKKKENANEDGKPMDIDEPERPVQEDKSRCWFAGCGKKLKISCLECRCGYRFCEQHRLPESHNCDYDYKTAGRNVLRKQNQEVVADKLDRL